MSGQSVRIGGLFRCCIQSVQERFDEGVTSIDPPDGEAWKCRYCSEWVMFRDGAWEWAKDHVEGEG